MKILKLFVALSIAYSVLFFGCGRLDEQAPSLLVTVDTTNFTGTVDEGHAIYLVFFMDNAWLTKILQYGTTGNTFYLPNVPVDSTYVAVFHDDDGDGTLSTGDPAMGYQNVAPTDPLVQLIFYPLQFRSIVIPLDDGVVYP